LDWCVTYGIPEEVVSDNGKEFCNATVKELWDRLKIKHRTTTPYHPRSNGQSERFNRDMVKFLERMITAEDCKTGAWPAFIPALMMSHNTSVHKGTKCSPFELMYGYQPNSVYQPNMEDIVHVPKDDRKQKDALARLQDTRAEVRDAARDALYLQQQHMLRANDRQKKTKEAGWKPKPLEQVWIRRLDITVPNPTLAQKVEPGMVIRCVAPDVYLVSRTNRKKSKQATLGIDLLRPKVTDVPAADPNLTELEEETEPEEEAMEAQIAEIRIVYDEVMAEVFEEATREWRKRGIPHSLSLDIPVPLTWAGGAATPGPSSTRPPPPSSKRPPTRPTKPSTPATRDDITEPTERSDGDEDEFSTPVAPTPKKKPKRNKSLRGRFAVEARRLFGNVLFPERTRSQRGKQ
jgi:hypothetical protein